MLLPPFFLRQSTAVDTDVYKQEQSGKPSQIEYRYMCVLAIFLMWFSVCFSVSFFCSWARPRRFWTPTWPPLGGQDGFKIAPKWSSERFLWRTWDSSNSLCFTIHLVPREGPKTCQNRVEGGFAHFVMHVTFHTVFEPLLELPKSNLVGNMSPPRGPKSLPRGSKTAVYSA